MKVSIGSENFPSDMASQRRAQMIALSISKKTPMPSFVQEELARAMRPSIGQDYGTGSFPVVPGQGNPNPVGVGGCYPSNTGSGSCSTQLDPRTIASIMANNQGSISPAPPGIDQATWAAIITYIQAQKYCPSPRRVGWQCSSLTFTTDAALADGASVDIVVTPANAFCANALVAAAGTSNDVDFQITSIVYGGQEYVTNGPLIARFYTAGSACCLCAKEFPIIDPGTDLTMTVKNVSGQEVPAGQIAAEMFGNELFCG